MAIGEREWAEERRRLENILRVIEAELALRRELARRRRSDLVKNRRMMGEDYTFHRVPEWDDLVEINSSLQDLQSSARDYASVQQWIHRLERMKSSPYFGRIDFEEEGSSQVVPVYIGIAGLSDPETRQPLVYDWRSPIASMFYDYELGPAQYNSRGGIVRGEVLLKRQYKIRNGQLHYMFDSAVTIDDEVLQDILGSSTDEKMKSIVTTIQREQNQAIRDTGHRFLLVEGPAGSGKTSIALHRVAFLLYRYRQSLRPQNIVVFSPNEVFNDYISGVLPELGESNMVQTTFQDQAERLLAGYGQVEDMYTQMEYLLTADRTSEAARTEGIRFKMAPVFARVLENYADYISRGGITFNDVVYEDRVVVSGRELNRLFQQDYRYLPIGRRLEKIRRRILFLLKPLEEEALQKTRARLEKDPDRKHVSREELNAEAAAVVRELFRPVKAQVIAQTRIDILSLYKQVFSRPEFLEELAEGTSLPENLTAICHYTLDALSQKRITYEDCAPLCLLRLLIEGPPRSSTIRHVIVDEAQDYSPVQLDVIKRLFPDSNLTLLGDANQAIHPYAAVTKHQTLARFLARDEGSEDTRIIRLNKSYRSTWDIMQFTGQVLGGDNPIQPVRRRGKKPQLVQVKDEGILPDAVARQVRELTSGGVRSVAVVCKSARESEQVKDRLAARIGEERVKLVTSEDTHFPGGLVVLPSYLAKGLEFDAVIVYNANERSYWRERERRLFYTVCTRALHYLYIYFAGDPSPFIQNVDPGWYDWNQI